MKGYLEPQMYNGHLLQRGEPPFGFAVPYGGKPACRAVSPQRSVLQINTDKLSVCICVAYGKLPPASTSVVLFSPFFDFCTVVYSRIALSTPHSRYSCISSTDTLPLATKTVLHNALLLATIPDGFPVPQLPHFL